MELRIAILFLFLYYIRPQDWIPGMEGFNIVRPLIVSWAVILYAAKRRSPVTGWVKTPHDWAMLAYWGWIVWSAPEPKDALLGFFPLVVFYAFTVHSLTSWEAVFSYLKAWNWMLVGIALLAAGSFINIDLTGAAAMTLSQKGRLAIGTWMHNNPNALGHSLAVVLPLSYLLYFWRGNSFGRWVLFPLQNALVIFCIYQTQSKGSFLVSAALMLLIFIIGRPLPVKIFVLALAVTMGVSALSFLPRMSDMNNLRSEEGVQGRLMAWEIAKTAMEKKPAGWKQFEAYINWRGQVEKKATHSSYVQIGGDLGVNGLYLFTLVLWTAFRSTAQIQYKGSNEAIQERCRRAVLVLIVAYAVSSWMINREYHTEYFLLVGVAAAMHRLQLGRQGQAALQEPEFGIKPQREWLVPEGMVPGPLLVQPWRLLTADTALVVESQSKILATPHSASTNVDDSVSAAEEAGLETTAIKAWNRLNWQDYAMGACLTWVVLYIWEYTLKNL
jgi:hypothetical protein